MLNKRIRIARRSKQQRTQFGEDGQPNYEWLGLLYKTGNVEQSGCDPAALFMPESYEKYAKF